MRGRERQSAPSRRIAFVASLKVLVIGLVAGMFSAGNAGAGEIEIRWDAVPDWDVAGYRVYYGRTLGVNENVVDVGNVTSTTLTGLEDCTFWYITVRAYDAGGLESEQDSDPVKGWPRPTVSSVIPGVIAQGDTVTFTVTGSNFYGGEDGVASRPPARVRLSHQDLIVRSTAVDSCSTMTVVVEAPEGAAPGFSTLYAENPDLTWDDPLSQPWVFGARQNAIEVLEAGNGGNNPEDTTPPTVDSTTPGNGAQDIAATVLPQVTFSEDVDSTTVSSSTVMLLNAQGQAVAQASGYPSTNANRVTLRPASALIAGATYRIRVLGGANGVKDLAGNPLASTYTQGTGFTVREDENPDPQGSAQVVSTWPAGGDSGISLDLTQASITFDRDMRGLEQVLTRGQLQKIFRIRLRTRVLSQTPDSPVFTNGGRRVVIKLADPMDAAALYWTAVNFRDRNTVQALKDAGLESLIGTDLWKSEAWTTDDGLDSVFAALPQADAAFAELTPGGTSAPPENSNIPLEAEFRLGFSHPVAQQTLTDNIFRVIRISKRGYKKQLPLAGIPVLEDGGRTVVIRTAEELKPGRKYRIVVRTGRSGIRLLTVNGMSMIKKRQKVRVNFTTELSSEAQNKSIGVAE